MLLVKIFEHFIQKNLRLTTRGKHAAERGISFVVKAFLLDKFKVSCYNIPIIGK